MDSMNKTHIIIGTSAAAIGCINKLRSLDPQSEIICISAESELPYNKCFLVDFWAGDKTAEQTATRKPEFFKENNIQLILGKKVIKIVSDQKRIVLEDGQEIQFDTLLISTGSRARKLNINGADQPHVFYFHTLNDTHRLMDYIKVNNPGNAVVIGSGFTGLEVADLLNETGVKTAVIERASRVMSSFFNEAESKIVQKAMNQKGVEFIGDEEVVEIGNSHLTLKSGKTIPADLIIIAIGVISNSELAQEAAIELHDGGIKTSEYLQTSIPHIYAAGDVATVKDQLTGQSVRSCMWADAMQQGMIVAHGMAGIAKVYPGVMTTGISTFFDLDIMVSGNTRILGKEIVYQTDESYRKYILKEGILQSFTLIGNLQKVGLARRVLMLQEKIDPMQLA